MKIKGFNLPAKLSAVMMHLANEPGFEKKYFYFVQVGIDAKKKTPVITATAMDSESLDVYEKAINHPKAKRVSRIVGTPADILFKIIDGRG